MNDRYQTQKPHGDEQRKGLFIRKFGACQDRQVLDIVMEEAQMYHWQPMDIVDIAAAYKARREWLK
jgi:hypothetical protein